LLKKEVPQTIIFRQVNSVHLNFLLYERCVADLLSFISIDNQQDINSTNTVFRKLGERLNSFPLSRCNLSECISLLTPGSKYVYLDVWQDIRNCVKARKIYLHTENLLHSLLGITLSQGHHFRKFQKDGEMQLAIGKRKPR
jgi:hypothetical protein